MAKIPEVSIKSKGFAYIERDELEKSGVHPMVIGIDDDKRISLAVSIIPPDTEKKYGGKGRVCGSVQRAVHEFLSRRIYVKKSGVRVYYRANIGFYFGRGQGTNESYQGFVKRVINGVELVRAASYYRLSTRIEPKPSNTPGLDDYDLFTTDGLSRHVVHSGFSSASRPKRSQRTRLVEPELNKYELEALRIEKVVETDKEQSRRRWESLTRTATMLRRKSAVLDEDYTEA